MTVIAELELSGFKIFQQLLVHETASSVLDKLDVSLVNVVVEGRFGAMEDLERIRYSDVFLFFLALLLLESRIDGSGHKRR